MQPEGGWPPGERVTDLVADWLPGERSQGGQN